MLGALAIDYFGMPEGYVAITLKNKKPSAKIKVVDK